MLFQWSSIIINCYEILTPRESRWRSVEGRGRTLMIGVRVVETNIFLYEILFNLFAHIYLLRRLRRICIKSYSGIDILHK